MFLYPSPPPTKPSGFSVTNIEYSLDNISYQPFGTGTVNQAISNNGTSSFTALYTPILALPNPLPNTGTNLYVRYTLPSTITTDGKQIGIYLRANTNGDFQSAPASDAAGTSILSTAAPNGGTLLTRDSTLDLSTPPPADVPGPLPLLGGAAAFGFSRRLRRRIGRKA